MDTNNCSTFLANAVDKNAVKWLYVWLAGVTVPDPEVGNVVHSADDGQKPTSAVWNQQTKEDESTVGAAGLIATLI